MPTFPFYCKCLLLHFICSGYEAAFPCDAFALVPAVVVLAAAAAAAAVAAAQLMVVTETETEKQQKQQQERVLIHQVKQMERW